VTSERPGADSVVRWPSSLSRGSYAGKDKSSVELLGEEGRGSCDDRKD